MKIDRRIKTLIVLLVFGAVCGAAVWFGDTTGAGLQAPWYSIIPPLLAIAPAFLTHHVIASLGIAILVGGIVGAAGQGSFG